MGYFMECRRYPRRKISGKLFFDIVSPSIRLVSGNTNREADLLDISKGGVGFFTDRYLPRGCLITLRFGKSKKSKSARVAYSKYYTEEKRYRMGAEFVNNQDDVILRK